TVHAQRELPAIWAVGVGVRHAGGAVESEAHDLAAPRIVAVRQGDTEGLPAFGSRKGPDADAVDGDVHGDRQGAAVAPRREPENGAGEAAEGQDRRSAVAVAPDGAPLGFAFVARPALEQIGPRARGTEVEVASRRQRGQFDAAKAHGELASVAELRVNVRRSQ